MLKRLILSQFDWIRLWDAVVAFLIAVGSLAIAVIYIAAGRDSGHAALGIMFAAFGSFALRILVDEIGKRLRRNFPHVMRVAR